MEACESGNLVVYNGAIVDVASMMQKLEKSEKAREEIEQRLMAQDAKMGKRPKAVANHTHPPKMSCRLHSVSGVRQDNDLAQFEFCHRHAQLHFQSIYLPVVSAETCAGTSKATSSFEMFCHERN